VAIIAFLFSKQQFHSTTILQTSTTGFSKYDTTEKLAAFVVWASCDHLFSNHT